jgi:CheY-like chemotaxis protein
MVVEDEPDLYDMVLTMYEMLGIEGVAFTDGEEAVSWIEEDIRLPGKVTGPMVGARLRQCAPMNNMAIVLMTAYKLSPQEEKAVQKQAGSNLLLYKPLPRLDDFRTVLEKLVKERHRREKRQLRR